MISPKSTKDTAEKVLGDLAELYKRKEVDLFTLLDETSKLMLRAKHLLASKRVNKKKVVADFLAGKRSSRGIEDIIRRASKRGKKGKGK